MSSVLLTLMASSLTLTNELTFTSIKWVRRTCYCCTAVLGVYIIYPSTAVSQSPKKKKKKTRKEGTNERMNDRHVRAVRAVPYVRMLGTRRWPRGEPFSLRGRFLASSGATSSTLPEERSKKTRYYLYLVYTYNRARVRTYARIIRRHPLVLYYYCIRLFMKTLCDVTEFGPDLSPERHVGRRAQEPADSS